MTVIEYKGYLIEPIETSAGRWRGRIRRADGRKIKNLITGWQRESFDTPGMEMFSPKDALMDAKEAIDGGNLDDDV